MRLKNTIYILFFVLITILVNTVFFYPKKKQYKPRSQTIQLLDNEKIRHYLDDINTDNNLLKILSFNIKLNSQQIDFIVQSFDNKWHVWVKSNVYKNHFEVKHDFIKMLCHNNNQNKNNHNNKHKIQHNLFCNIMNGLLYDFAYLGTYPNNYFLKEKKICARPLSPPPKCICII